MTKEEILLIANKIKDNKATDKEKLAFLKATNDILKKIQDTLNIAVSK
jgi:hypothetical protein